MHIFDKLSNKKFLIDTGAVVSILPQTQPLSDQSAAPYINLVAANGSGIPNFGFKTFSIDLGFGPVQHDFLLAPVREPLIGIDFMYDNDLVVIPKTKQLLKLDTFRTMKLTLASHKSQRVYTIQNCPIKNIIQTEFKELLTPSFRSKPTHPVQHHIETTGRPVFAKARRLDSHKLELAKKEFGNMIQLGIIRPSSSPWASPLHLVEKSDGGWRPCGDYRRLNDITTPDRYPVPHIQDFSNHLSGKVVFSKIDLIKGFYNIPLNPEDIPKTAVITPFGLFEYLRMPFGLRNAAQTFQRFMNSIFGDLPDVYIYIDDILIASENDIEHEKLLRMIFERLRDHGLAIHMTKSLFKTQKLDFLGHTVTNKGILPVQDKVKAIEEFPKPSTRKGLQQFLGTLNYYHRFIKHAAHRLAPLHKAAHAKPFIWSDSINSNFELAKKILASNTMLSYPNSNAKLALSVDASDIAVGGVLEQ